MKVKLQEPLLMEIKDSTEFIIVDSLDLSAFKYGQMKVSGYKYDYDSEQGELKGKHTEVTYDLEENGVWETDL